MKKEPVNVSELVRDIRGEFGRGSAALPGAESDFMIRRIPHWISVGNLLNPVFGNFERGLPCGYYSELSGEESQGKTTLLYYLFGRAQRLGYVTILSDVEHSYNLDWAEKQRVDNGRLVLLESAYMKDRSDKMVVRNVKEHFEMWDFALRRAHKLYHRPILLGVDSLAALLPKSALKGEYDERAYPALASAMAQNIPRFQPVLIQTNTHCMFVNQLREKLGILFGDRETTPGGKAKNFYFWSRIRISKTRVVRNSKGPVAIECRIKNKKNKVGTPFKEANAEINFEEGFRLAQPESKAPA